MSQPVPAPQPRPGSWKRELVSFFGSLKLAIGLLLAIAAASIIGTVLPQDQGPSVIREATFPDWVKTLLLAISAHDVYHTAWFLLLLGALFVNLAVCTWLRFPATWKRYRLQTPPAPSSGGLIGLQRLALPPDESRLDVLRKRGWRVTRGEGGVIFAEKYKFTRLAPTFIHISLFLVIGGAIWGGLSGVKHSLPVMVGERISSETVYDQALQRGRLASAPPPFEVRLDAFRMTFRPSGMVKQYYSDVTVLPRDGRPPFQRTLWVNEPLIVDGMYFYQSFWGVGAVSWLRDGQAERLPLTRLRTGGNVSKPFQLGAASYILFLRDLAEPAVLVDAKELQPRAQVLPGLPVVLDGHRFEVQSYHLFSGLETKVDPGIPLVYLGCGMMLLGLAMMPFRHCEAWIRADEAGWIIGGRSHRGRVVLQRELATLASVWNGGATPAPVMPQVGASAS